MHISIIKFIFELLFTIKKNKVMRESLLMLTDRRGQTVLIGVHSIINVKQIILEGVLCTDIESRGAMISTTFVKETPEQIFDQYKNKK